MLQAVKLLVKKQFSQNVKKNYDVRNQENTNRW